MFLISSSFIQNETTYINTTLPHLETGLPFITFTAKWIPNRDNGVSKNERQ